MSADIGAIRAALAASLQPAFDGQTFPYQQFNPTPPCAQVSRGPVTYDEAFGAGVNQMTFIVTAFVALTSDQGAQTLLDDYLAPTGAKSIKAALEADETLGGQIQTLHVTDATGETVFNREQGGPVLGSQWTVETWI